MIPDECLSNNFHHSIPIAQLNLPYAICEIVVAICAVLSNALVITVFWKDKKLRRRTNYYIISLAAADLLVGLFAIPFAVLSSIGLPENLHACLFTVSVLLVLCTISIFCLVAVSIDRYWAILYPMGYSRNIRTRTALVIICICWIAGTLVGFLPLLGWNAGLNRTCHKCIFVEVMDYNYLVFLYVTTIVFPAFLIAAFYAHIYRVVVQQLQQMKPIKPSKPIKQSTEKLKNGKNNKSINNEHGQMLRVLGAAQKRDVKATQNLSRIVIFFIICWFPLYTINCVQAFCRDCNVNDFFMNFCIILSHLNSVGNPILYACHLKDFRGALEAFIMRNFVPRKFRKVKKSVEVILDENFIKKFDSGVKIATPEEFRIDLAHENRETDDDYGPEGVISDDHGDRREEIVEESQVSEGFNTHVLYLKEDEIIVERSINC